MVQPELRARPRLRSVRIAQRQVLFSQLAFHGLQGLPGAVVGVLLDETHVDHRIPSAKGGPSEVDNGQVLCRDCNLKKGDKDPREK